MKTKTSLYLLAVSAAALSLSVPTARGQPFVSVEDLNNRAIANSPRAIEAFPWLARQVVTKLDSKAALAAVTKNRALAASPRMVEQFPELVRPVQLARETPERGIASTVLKNRGLASSPRALEEFPWLNRGGLVSEAFQIAPLK